MILLSVPQSQSSNIMSRVSVIVLCCVAYLAVCNGRQGFGPGDQEWGFVEVRPGAHMFYWLYYTTSSQVSSPEERPLVIWLQGGPGASSSYGNFAEIGTLHINLTERSSAWSKHVNLLFIDNPVGTGYSYVERSSLLTTTNVQIGSDLVEFITNFYKTFPSLLSTPLYIFCESYGGKMVIEFARQLSQVADSIGVDFRGVALGDSWISPIDSVNTWAPFLKNMGLVDERGYQSITQSANSVQSAINAGNWVTATNRWGITESVVSQATDGVDFYNVLYKTRLFRKNPRQFRSPVESLYRNHVFDPETRDDDADLDILMNGQVKKALNIPSGVTWGGQSDLVFSALSEDFMKSVTDVVSEVLDNTNLQVYVFTGQLDLIVDTPGTVEWVDRLSWSGSIDWQRATRYSFGVDGYIEGYVKEAKNLHLYWINRAGHMVPTDNPLAGIELLRRVTKYDQ